MLTMGPKPLDRSLTIGTASSIMPSFNSAQYWRRVLVLTNCDLALSAPLCWCYGAARQHS